MAAEAAAVAAQEAESTAAAAANVNGEDGASKISCEANGSEGVRKTKHDNIFCYHSKSSSIMPAGFCELAGIKLTTPADWSSEYDTFTWAEYLEKNKGSRLAPPHLCKNIIK